MNSSSEIEMKLKNYAFRQTLNFSPLGHLKKNDGGECFAPLAFALRAEMLKNGGQDPQEKAEIQEDLASSGPLQNNISHLCLSVLLLT